MKKTKENIKETNFTKLTNSGISLIVLVITIIVIIILAAAVIITLNNNNPIMEANTARYESDRANTQAVFTNAVSKIMAKNQATLTVSPGQINTITGGQKEVEGSVAYTLIDAQNSSNATGTIVFGKGDNTDTTFYTGKKLPIYAAGETKWYVDDEGNISLEVAGTKYGKGEILNIPENALINLYEDLAGDETGVTQGKLHIGDYVNYNPIASGVTEKNESNGYKYVSLNDVNGLTESLIYKEDYSHFSTVTSQSFTTQENLKWRVIGFEGNNILITTEEAIMPDTPLTALEETGYFMYGAKAYVNGLNELENISKIYGNGELAQSATGINIAHINKIAGVTVTEDTILPEGVEQNEDEGWEPYGSEYSFEAGHISGWSPSAWIQRNSEESSPGISGKSDAYIYYLENSLLKSSTSNIRHSLIKKEGSIPYFLASRAKINLGIFVGYGPGMVEDGRVSSSSRLFRSVGDGVAYGTHFVTSGGALLGVRPVVKLKPNVVGSIQSTDSNGVSYWNIELE